MAPNCDQHGPMKLRPAARMTADQAWYGTWYDCQHPRCYSSALQPSEELLQQRRELQLAKTAER